MKHSLLRRPTRSDRGAAAVEFALVCPVLFLVLLGIVQYGLYLHDSLNAQQGVREAARQAVVQDSADMAAIRADVEEEIGGSAGDVNLRITAPEGWARGNPLEVCIVVASLGDFGPVPLPHDGYVRAELRMSIEKDDTSPGGGTSDSDPSGGGWSWC